MLAAALTVALAGCATSAGWFASSGPDRNAILHTRDSGIRLLSIDASAAQRLEQSETRQLFSTAFARRPPSSAQVDVIGLGDVLSVSIWEAPPAALFSATVLGTTNTTVSALVTTLPQQIVEADGSIQVPFAGSVPVAGKTPEQVDAEIEERLRGKAHQPQAVVQIANRNSSAVTVVGDVTQSVRMPLTPKGERLLDAIAAAGGVRDPVNKVSVQITRGDEVRTLPLDLVIRDPAENVMLAPGDVITTLFQSQSYTVLGATGTNAEIDFEAKGISLAQALGRSGGLLDNRADARGVFLFRLEDPNAVPPDARRGPTMPDGRIPVIYWLDLKNPASFLVAEDFPMHNHDVLYVSTAAAAELQKFLTILTSSIYSVNTLINLGN